MEPETCLSSFNFQDAQIQIEDSIGTVNQSVRQMKISNISSTR